MSANPNERHASSILVTMAGSALAPLASLATAPVLAVALSPDGRGAVAAATAPLMLAVSAGTIGVPASVTYFSARGSALRGVVGRAVVLMLLAGGVATALVLAAGGWLAGGDAQLHAIVVAASLAIVPSLVVYVFQALASGLGRWRLVAAERSLSACVRFGAIGVAALCGALTVEFAVVVIALAPLCGALVYLLLLRGPSRPIRTGSTTVESVRLGQMLAYGLRVWGGSVSGVLLARVDQAVLAPMVGVTALGLYAVAVTISDLPRIISDAARDVSFAADAGAPEDDRLARTARIASLAVTTGSVALAGSLWWLVPLVFGPEYVDAIPMVVVLLAATVVGSASTIAGVALIARGHPGVRSLAYAVGCAVNVAVLVALVPVIGVMAAAVATVAGSVALALVNSIALRTRLGLDVRRFVGLRRGDLAAARTLLSRRLGRKGVVR